MTFLFKVKFQFLVLLYGLGTHIAVAQSALSFKQLTQEDGLSSNLALSIAQDKKGFLWIGTMDGLNRYDGKKIKIFKEFYSKNPIAARIKITRLVADKKNNLWIGTNNGLYLYNNKTDSFRVFYHSSSTKTGIANNFINELFFDSKENLWIGTKNGLSKLAANHTNFAFQTIPLNTMYNDVHAVFETSTGQVLVGTTKGLVTLMPTSTARKENTNLKGIHVVSIAEDKGHYIWIGTYGSGVYRINKDGLGIKNLRHNPTIKNSLASNIVRKVFADRYGKIWIGSLKGLNIFNPTTQQFQVYKHNPKDKYSLNFNSIYDIYEDRQGSVWLATFFGGLNGAESFKTAFKIYRNEGDNKGISSDIIGPILGDRDHLWIGTEAEGLNSINRKQTLFKHYKGGEPGKTSLTSNLIKTLAFDADGRLWVGMHDGAINILDKRGRIVQRINQHEGLFKVNSDHVIALLLDHNKRMWIGTEEDGVSIYDFKAGKAVDFDKLYPRMPLAGNAITCFFEDSKKNMWIGTHQGLNRLSADGSTLESFLQTNQVKQSQPEYINCITEDKQGVIWIGTNLGLSYYDPTKNKIGRYTVASGLANNKVVGIIADDRNVLWISTENGLSRLDASRKSFNSFNEYDGLPGNVFNSRSFYKDKDGRLYFGSYTGLIAFWPQQIELNKSIPQIILTGLTVNGKAVNARDQRHILQSDISETTGIEMEYDQNLISIDYAVLNFIKPDKNRSAYKLEGYDHNWIYTSGSTASYTNIPPGSYKLQIKGCNNDGVWNSTPTNFWITILPPPWKTWWAYTLYVVGISLLIFGVVFFFVSRTGMRRKLRYEHMVNAKQEELHQMKTDFFTHISHEIRTPLTLILGPVEVLMEEELPTAAKSKLLKSIKKNAERVLKLTTDLLEFRKSDSGYTQLKIKAVNIIAFSQEVFRKFKELASKKHIDFKFTSTEKNIELYIDPHYMEIVLSNLLSNAIKFTEERGKISVKVMKIDEETVEIVVRDNGSGIPPESQDKIFTSFYQADAGGEKHTGSGIGLAFSQKLVELHQGRLYFKSERNTETKELETCFIIKLQCGLHHFNDSSLIQHKSS